jgi:hypothetical protein
MNQEIIELLEAVKERGIFDSGAIIKLDQALAKLHAEQPPASEYAIIFRKFLCYPDTALNSRDPIQWQDMSFEACDIIDRAEADKAELVAALKEARKDFYHIHQHPSRAHTNSYKFMEKVEKIIAKFKTEQPKDPKKLQATPDIKVGNTVVPGVKKGSAKDTQADYGKQN